MATAGPKVGFFTSERDDSEGPQSSQTKRNRHGHNTFPTNISEIAKVSRIVASGGFQLRHVLVTFGEGLAPMQLFRQPETLLRGREEARA